ncbi:hypothetical protein Sked_37540 [Sanguibacter keddieii DSM 10542]|jgi:hypothetical protein|uniref:Uncharacterized protein n=1 Tax=Sanguibacter keddieii (strain ATCC 51767 / DSM 10542 / NCFB 3025 / ST-74) TaxID=446469 RepID=D1BGC0_SANKS|nr:hypothetical protein [Sanguibacter keddieii]ACZ23637.1 hypothetical protein Sked_37540 [Sanguibacter keddieii DSM 10542]
MSWLFGRRGPAVPDTPAPVAAPEPQAPFHDVMEGHLRGLVGAAKQSGATLPVPASILLFSMLDNLNELLDHTLVAPPTVDEQIAIEFMIKDYIPSTVNAFLASRAERATKEELLLSQLRLLDGRVHSMVTAVYAHDNAQLEINGRFLREKFG